MDDTFAGAKQALLISYTPGSSHSGGKAISGGRRLGDTRGVMLAAAVAWQEGLAAPGVLLIEAGDGPAEVLRF
jgi:hypothetical protein